jgi:guanylate kinase
MALKKAVIISAPSGSGKTTLVKYLLDTIPELQFSISATSRIPRNHEIDRKDYYFLSREEFMRKIKNHEFIEWEEVYKGTFYGTLKAEIDRIWSSDKSVIFDVDVQGGIHLKKYFGHAGLSIFIMVKDSQELEKRLRDRNTDSEDSIKNRLEKARNEMQYKDQFDHIVINDDLEKTRENIYSMVSKFLKS